MRNNEIPSQTKVPDDSKVANATAFFKQEDSMLLTKRRPASVLLVISKVFQKYFQEKIDKYLLLEKYLSLYLSKYSRVGPISLFENWKNDLGGKGFVSAILMEDGKIKTMGRCKIIKLGLPQNHSNNATAFGKSAHLPIIQKD